jgi:hypothetical protein
MLPFKILFDDSFVKFNSNKTLVPVDRKFLLSLVNDFEDGQWRFNNFQRFLWNNVAETALSFNEREKLIGNPATTIASAAQNLRLTDKEKDISKGSELAEILLYGIMKYKYGALPVVPKIFYKQNPKDNAKGADSVHIVIESGNDFSLWFGEAKFYNSIEDARLATIIESVENSLKTDKLKKENSIITDLSDIDRFEMDEDLRGKIKDALDTEKSIDELKPKLHIPILLLHECKLTAKETEFTDEYVKKIIDYHLERAQSYFEKQIETIAKKIHKYSEISFHIILFPVPKKDSIVNTFLESAEFHQKQ